MHDADHRRPVTLAQFHYMFFDPGIWRPDKLHFELFDVLGDTLGHVLIGPMHGNIGGVASTQLRPSLSGKGIVIENIKTLCLPVEGADAERIANRGHNRLPGRSMPDEHHISAEFLDSVRLCVRCVLSV